MCKISGIIVLLSAFIPSFAATIMNCLLCHLREVLLAIALDWHH
jgi:hypothetical protein